MEWKMLKLLNKDRKAHGLKPLKMQQDLREVARKHSRDMARKDYFEHENIHGQTPFDRLSHARVTDVIAGENLAKIKGHKNAVKQAEIGLMNSPSHRDNILHKDFNTVGIGIIKAVNKAYYFTQNFALREIVFNKKVPHRITKKKGLRLRGETFGNIQRLWYMVKRNENDKNPLKEGIINIKNNEFDFVVPFDNTGIFQVFLYTNKQGDTDKFKIANKFEIKVRTGWF
jgi:hypothetical protein